MNRNQNNKRIDYIEIYVHDIKEAKRFYKAVFAWEFVDYGETYCSFFDGRMYGGLEQVDEVKPGGPLVVFYSTQIEALQQKIQSEGGEIVKDIFKFPGGRRFHFKDLSGNELAVWTDLD